MTRYSIHRSPRVNAVYALNRGTGKLRLDNYLNLTNDLIKCLMNCQSWFDISGHQYFQVHEYKVSQNVTPANEILRERPEFTDGGGPEIFRRERIFP